MARTTSFTHDVPYGLRSKSRSQPAMPYTLRSMTRGERTAGQAAKNAQKPIHHIRAVAGKNRHPKTKSRSTPKSKRSLKKSSFTKSPTKAFTREAGTSDDELDAAEVDLSLSFTSLEAGVPGTPQNQASFASEQSLAAPRTPTGKRRPQRGEAQLSTMLLSDNTNEDELGTGAGAQTATESDAGTPVNGNMYDGVTLHGDVYRRLLLLGASPRGNVPDGVLESRIPSPTRKAVVEAGVRSLSGERLLGGFNFARAAAQVRAEEQVQAQVQDQAPVSTSAAAAMEVYAAPSPQDTVSDDSEWHGIHGGHELVRVDTEMIDQDDGGVDASPGYVKPAWDGTLVYEATMIMDDP